MRFRRPQGLDEEFGPIRGEQHDGRTSHPQALFQDAQDLTQDVLLRTGPGQGARDFGQCVQRLYVAAGTRATNVAGIVCRAKKILGK
jgi:hypothetical protein